MKHKLRIASRSSNLALKQVDIFKERTQGFFNFEIIKIKTKADKRLNDPLYKIGGKGLFVKELEKYLLEDKADVAVHSLKDMETELAVGTFIGAVMPRESRNDVLFSNYPDLFSLPENAIIGTSSPRRTAFLRAFRKDFNIEMCRGNIETRIKKFFNNSFDALILAEAGLKRLQINYSNVISLEILPPPAGQGVIAIQCVDTPKNNKINHIINSINDEKTFNEIISERSLVKNLNGSCRSPISSSANIDSYGYLTLNGYVANVSGTKIINENLTGNVNEADAIGKKLAHRLILKGAQDILNEVD